MFPGTSHLDQVSKIFSVIGYELNEELGFPMDDNTQIFMNSRNIHPKKSLTTIIPTNDEETLNLLTLLLAIQPNERPNATEILNNIYFSHDVDVTCDYNKKYVQTPTMADFLFEYEEFPLEELQDMVREEVRTTKSIY